MATENDRIVEVRDDGPRWVGPAVIVLGIIAIAGLGFGWYASSRTQDVQQALTNEVKVAKQGFSKEVEGLQQRLAQTEQLNTQLQGDLGVVTKRLRITQGELKKARAEAAQIREDSTKQLTAMDTAIKDELANKASNDQVKAVSTEVGGVRTDLDTTRKDLQMARSEMGTLIARNHEEIEQLRRLGERDYVEFTLDAKNKPTKVGNITVELRGTNPKKNQYSVAMVVEDLRVEKRNRQVNEPIFFYPRGTKTPLELVVNKVEKNKVVGYMSVPKVSRSSASGSGN